MFDGGGGDEKFGGGGGGGDGDGNSYNSYKFSLVKLTLIHQSWKIGKTRTELQADILVTHGYYLVKGKQGHAMEDYVVAQRRKIDGSGVGLYATFDGHSGQDVADYLQAHLFDNILNEKALSRTHREKLTNEILEEVIGYKRGGLTAVTAIFIDGKKEVIANVGDSRVVICRKGVAKQLSVDHEPKKERGTIDNKGAFVTKAPGYVPRVDGQLARARAFGDGRLK